MKKRKHGKLAARITRIVVIMNLLLGAALINLSYISYRNTFREVYSDKAENTARMVADMIDGDKMSDYAHTLKKDAYYEELEDVMSKLKKDSGASYLYLYYPESDHLIYILEACCEEDDESMISQLGDEFKYRQTEYTYLVPDVEQLKPSTDLILAENSGLGAGVSAWAPILNSDGELMAYAEADYEMTLVEKSVKSYAWYFIAITLIGIAIILVIILIVIRKYLSKPLSDVTDIIESFNDGKFSVEGKEIHTGDEIEDVYETFVKMVAKIDDYVDSITQITAEKGRIETELNVATQIQAAMLPGIFPPFPEKKEIDIFATMRPAKEVGGDFYDFFMIDDTHLGFVIADVSGKGVPAALFMVIAKTIIKNHATMGLAANEVFEHTNDQVSEGNREGYFITSWIGVLDLETGEIEYANAGHNPPVVLRKAGEEWNVKYIDEEIPDLVLGAMADMPYGVHHLKLEPGDRLFLYTDGVPESINVNEEAYSEERLLDELKNTNGKSIVDSIRFIQESVDTFAGEEEQFDDITMLLLEYRGKEAIKE